MAARKKKIAVETVELTMSINYVDNWSTRHGIRELVQNAIDAEKILGHRMELAYDPDCVRLRIVTHGTTLEMKTLLLGVSEKGGTGAIGKYGEGYKVGVLAIIRDGKRIEFRTGDQKWKPRLDRSESFGVPTLHFDIEKGYDFVNQIEIIIHGITPTEWEEYQLMFGKTSNWTHSISTKLIPYYSDCDRMEECTLLLDPKQAGRLYVGGIYVCSNKRLKFGYNLPPERFELDRDRDNLRQYELEPIISLVWQSIFVDAWEDEDVSKQDFVLNLIRSSDSVDLAYINEARSIFKKAILGWIRNEYGDKVYPVPDIDKAHEASKLGVTATIIPPQIWSWIASEFPTMTDLVNQKEKEVIQSWSIDSLEKSDANILRWAWNKVLKASAKRLSGFNLAPIPMPQVAEFCSSNIEGVNAGGLIFIKRDMLNHKGRLLVTLVHEYVHQITGKHGEAMLSICEQIYEEIINELSTGLILIGELEEVNVELTSQN